MEKPHFTPNPVAKDEMEHEGAPVSVVLHWPCLPDTRCCDYDGIDIVLGASLIQSQSLAPRSIQIKTSKLPCHLKAE